MRVAEARAICPDLVLVAQRPDLFRRAHNTLMNEVYCEIPIETVKSIDEMTCTLDITAIADPLGLAKIACKVDKPNGVTIWRPEDMPAPLFKLPIDSVPGVGRRMQTRLAFAGIATISDLWHAQPKRLRALWGNVTGERMWYALHASVPN
jgi:DNA polymerase-4